MKPRKKRSRAAFSHAQVSWYLLHVICFVEWMKIAEVNFPNEWFQLKSQSFQGAYKVNELYDW